MDFSLPAIYMLGPGPYRWQRIMEASWVLPPNDMKAFIEANNIDDSAWVISKLGYDKVLIDSGKAIAYSRKPNDDIWANAANNLAMRLHKDGNVVELFRGIIREVARSIYNIQQSKEQNALNKRILLDFWEVHHANDAS